MIAFPIALAAKVRAGWKIPPAPAPSSAAAREFAEWIERNENLGRLA